jgi:acetyltransferase-like isoleucine patch superfamily enzyme
MLFIYLFIIRSFIRVKGQLSLIFYNSIFKNLQVEKNVVFKNIPSILLLNNAKIVLSKKVQLNSSNFNYHLNLFKPVKLLADGKNALIFIGENSRIHGSCIHASYKITIGSNCLIAANCQIIDNNAHELSMDNPSERINTIDLSREVIIENNVWIGSGCTILPGTKIGEGSVIAANSVVRGTVPKNCIFGGNPGKLIKQY